MFAIRLVKTAMVASTVLFAITSLTLWALAYWSIILAEAATAGLWRASPDARVLQAKTDRLFMARKKS